jgi:O-antigen/teichoic acid export membrane protein
MLSGRRVEALPVTGRIDAAGPARPVGPQAHGRPSPDDARVGGPSGVDPGRIARNSALWLGTQVPAQVVYAAYAVILARWLGPEQFGVHAALWSMFVVLAALAEDGLAIALTREVARVPARAAASVSNAAVLALLLGPVLGAVIPIVAIALGYPRAVVGMGVLAGLALWLRTIWSVVGGGFNGLQRLGLTASLWIVVSVVNAGVGLPLLLDGWGLTGVFAAAITGETAALALALVLVRRALPGVSTSYVGRVEVLRLASTALPFGTRALIGLVYLHLDVILLSALAGFDKVGLFRVAQKVLEVAWLLPTAISRALFPVLSGLHAGPRDRLRAVFERQAFLLTALAVPLAATLAWFAPTVIQVLLGAGYGAAAPILATLAGAVFLVYVRAPLHDLAASGPAQMRLTALSVIWLIANLAANLALIPRLGALGPAWARVASELIGIGVLTTMLRAFVRPRSFAHMLVGIGAAGLFALAVALTLAQVNTWLALLGLPAYGWLAVRLAPEAERQLFHAGCLGAFGRLRAVLAHRARS